ncbi:hypothetical protein [Neptuniibacter sp.]|uniref:hypothetical protein n=1 Tax=Neptuniibacter sp. TaxID=1962643 RepID=UPI00261BF50D|nr:hypothetical protein [Neptuniibacter sp.]MCP4597296.1 type II secretion system protein M [Neptuniibacter sp.]
MIKQWQQWSDKWDGLSQRERMLLLVTAIVVPVLLIYVWLIEQPLISVQKTPKQITAVETEIGHQKRLLNMLQGQKVKDPNIAAREELKKLRRALSDENKKIRRAAKNLVSPEQMLVMLRSVLAEGQGAQLKSAKSMEVEKVQLSGKSNESGEAAGPNGSDVASAVIYVHPFEVELQGSYQGIYDYLLKLEQLDGVFFWDLLEYKVDQHPTATVRLQVHTLSSEAGWLGA